MAGSALGAYWEKGDFVRLREVSATYTFSEHIASLAKARNASITFTGRNLWLRTNYRGVDPETDRNASVDSNFSEDFQTIAPPSYFVLRFNLGF